MADTPDSKSGGVHSPCGFESHLRHHTVQGPAGAQLACIASAAPAGRLSVRPGLRAHRTLRVGVLGRAPRFPVALHSGRDRLSLLGGHRPTAPSAGSLRRSWLRPGFASATTGRRCGISTAVFQHRDRTVHSVEFLAKRPRVRLQQFQCITACHRSHPVPSDGSTGTIAAGPIRRRRQSNELPNAPQVFSRCGARPISVDCSPAMPPSAPAWQTLAGQPLDRIHPQSPVRSTPQAHPQA